jgi:hypothetical protein
LLHYIAMAGGTVTVCSMCGDVGFPDKLFQCARCRHRFQHSYVFLPPLRPASHSIHLLLRYFLH